MAAVRYAKELHLASVTAWANAYGIAFQDWFLPPTGFIVPGVIATFLYRTDSGVAYVEPTIGNPDVSSKDKMTALHQVWELMLEEVKSDPKIRRLAAHTHHDSIANAAKEMGFDIRSRSLTTILSYSVK